MNPEIDKIASAALDGEASAEELARVADDASFVAAKADLGAVSEFLAHQELPKPPPGLAESQISVAMEQFKADAAQSALLAAQPAAAAAASSTSSSAEPKWSLPSWLVPALFSVAVLGGLGIAASSLSSGNETASVEASDSALMAETTEAMEDAEASGAMDDAMEEAMEEEAEEAMDDAPETTMELAEEPSADEDDARTTTTSADAGAAAIPDPIDLDGAAFEAFKSLPADEVARRATSEPPRDPDEYDRCEEQHGYTPPQGAENLVSVVPFIRDSEPAEVLVYETNDPEVRIALILSESCEVLDQS